MGVPVKIRTAVETAAAMNKTVSVMKKAVLLLRMHRSGGWERVVGRGEARVAGQ